MLVLTVLLSSISINVKAQGQDANYGSVLKPSCKSILLST